MCPKGPCKFTSLSLESEESVKKVIEIYKQRWHIETYFKALKEGCCRVEHCGLKSYDRLIKYVAVFSILAWRLYWARHLQSTDPEAPAEIAFTPIEIELIRYKNPKFDLHPMSISLALKLVSKMGGFNMRKGDGDPGIISLWRGYMKLQDKVDGYVLALDMVKKKKKYLS